MPSLAHVGWGATLLTLLYEGPAAQPRAADLDSQTDANVPWLLAATQDYPIGQGRANTSSEHRSSANNQTQPIDQDGFHSTLAIAGLLAVLALLLRFVLRFTDSSAKVSEPCYIQKYETAAATGRSNAHQQMHDTAYISRRSFFVTGASVAGIPASLAKLAELQPHLAFLAPTVWSQLVLRIRRRRCRLRELSHGWRHLKTCHDLGTKTSWE